tara:strand:- start:23344 stop:24168 length:825 start_codon:yes stop_codon:yes gene_type:complete
MKIKNILSIGVAALLGASPLMAQSLENLSAKAEIGYESERVYRGEKRAQHTMVNYLEVDFAFPEQGSLYAEIFGYTPLNGQNEATSRVSGLGGGLATEILPSIGITWNAIDMITLDGGFTYHRYITHKPFGGTKSTREVYLGVIADVMFTPAVYYSYDTTLRQHLVELSAQYSLELEEWGLVGFTVDSKAYGGWLRANDLLAGNGGGSKKKNGYNYVGFNSDLVYHFNETSNVRVGARVAHNTDRDGVSNSGPANRIGGHATMFWWGAAASFGF